MLGTCAERRDTGESVWCRAEPDESLGAAVEIREGDVTRSALVPTTERSAWSPAPQNSTFGTRRNAGLGEAQCCDRCCDQTSRLEISDWCDS